tara:strand:- start:920 stop:1312 length:393 start_codon:yes stop_codon:yes gene_type:complete
MQPKLTFLYDGGCPLCLRETNFLKNKDKYNEILFVDISQNYDQTLYQNISYTKAMSNLHGIMKNGEVILGVDVLAYSYELIGLGWIYYPTKIPVISYFIKFIYKFWAKYRLQLTGRNKNVALCDSNCERI